MDHPVLSLDPYTIGCRCTTSSPTGPGVITGCRSLDPLKTSARLTPNHIVPEMLREHILAKVVGVILMGPESTVHIRANLHYLPMPCT